MTKTFKQLRKKTDENFSYVGKDVSQKLSYDNWLKKVKGIEKGAHGIKGDEHTKLSKQWRDYKKEEVELEEGRLDYEFELRSDYGNDGGPHSFSGTINASSKQDARKQVAAIMSKKMKEVNKKSRGPGNFEPDYDVLDIDTFSDKEMDGVFDMVKR